MSKKQSKTPELRIMNTNMKLKRQLINVARNQQMTLTTFTLYHLRKIIAGYPDTEKRSEEDDDGC